MQNGNLYADKQKFQKQVHEQLNRGYAEEVVTEVEVYKVMYQMVHDKALYYEDGALYSAKLYHFETQAAKDLATLLVQTHMPPAGLEDLITQAQPGVLGHVVAVDVAHLHGLQMSERSDGGHALQDVGHADASGLIIGCFAGISASGDGASGGDDHDIFHHKPPVKIKLPLSYHIQMKIFPDFFPIFPFLLSFAQHDIK